MLKKIMLALILAIYLPAISHAAQVYLKDGGIIDCRYAKKQGENVYILINWFTEITLDKSEVQLRKTFGNRNSIGSLQPKKKKTHHSR